MSNYGEKDISMKFVTDLQKVSSLGSVDTITITILACQQESTTQNTITAKAVSGDIPLTLPDLGAITVGICG
jgi:hypothetical protein